jgi:hypothetical protein
MARTCLIILLVAATVGFGWGCGREKLPSREEIPILREKLFALQTAVLQRNPSAIDSLASAQMLDKGESADSLLSLVYGPQGDFRFKEFGDYSIFFGNKVAVISCKIIDSAANVSYPVKFTYKKYDKVWLLNSFKVTDEAASEK